MVSSSKLFEVFITFPFDNFSLVLFKIRADAYNHKDRSRSIIPKKTVTQYAEQYKLCSLGITQQI